MMGPFVMGPRRARVGRMVAVMVAVVAVLAGGGAMGRADWVMVLRLAGYGGNHRLVQRAALEE